VHGKRSKIRGWRKITSATWGHPNDPQIYGDLEVDAGNLLAFIDDARAATGVRLSVTHMVGKGIAQALGEHPDLNVHLHGNYFIHNPTVDIFFIVSTDAGAELDGVKVVGADRKPVVDIARELSDRAGRIRSGDDAEMGKTKKVIGRMPRRLLGVSMRTAAWLTTDKGADLKKYGLPRQPFGSAMVSSVGMFGIQHAYAPLSPYYRIPFLVLVGEVAEKPAVVDGAVGIRPMLTVSATMDHRYVDGFHAARLAKSTRAYLGDPKRFEPAL
jgi:pyruvate dehydrogenase E2 component (dihydrolipoamide acetyltransferase)